MTIIKAKKYNGKILVISDRGSVDSRYDKSLKLISSWMEKFNDRALSESTSASKIEISHNSIVPDDIERIQNDLKSTSGTDILIATGGTGLSSRDVTPQAVIPLLDYRIEGVEQWIYRENFELIGPKCALGRLLCGIMTLKDSHRCFVLCLPGKPSACIECLDAISPILRSLLQHISLGGSTKCDLNQSSFVQGKVCMCSDDLGVSNEVSSKEYNGDALINRPRKSIYPMVQLSDALYFIQKSLPDKLDTESIDIFQLSSGDVLAEDLISCHDVPKWDVSFLDGYALRYSEVNSKTFKYHNNMIMVKVCGNSVPSNTSTIDNNADGNLNCIRVTTGGKVPEPFDCVVMVEQTRIFKTRENDSGMEEDIILIEPEAIESLKRGKNVRPKANDVTIGQILLESSTEIRSQDGVIGLSRLSIKQGNSSRIVKIYRKPKVGVLSSGDEVSDAPSSGVIDMNRPNLLALVKQSNADVIDLGIAKDTVHSIAEKLDYAINDCSVDVIVCSGGVSMGEKDLLKEVIVKKFNASIHFGRVNLKPGKPTVFATIDRKKTQGTMKRVWVFGLPGNPVSTITTFHVLVSPLINVLRGLLSNDRQKRDEAFCLNPLFQCFAAHEFPRDAQRPEFHRVKLKWDSNEHKYIAYSTGSQKSSRLLSYTGCDALVLIDPGNSSLSQGTALNVLKLFSI